MRNDFNDKLLKCRLEADVFRRVRLREIIDKVEALLARRFLLAMKTSFPLLYLTDKFLEHEIFWTVPVNFGAPDVAKFFNSKSFICLTLYDHEGDLEAVYELAGDDLQSRLEAVSRASEMLINRYSQCLAHNISSLLERELADGKSFLVGDFNPFIQGLSARLLPTAKGWLR